MKQTFDELAEEFWMENGFYPPGKDNHLGIYYESEEIREKLWKEFLERKKNETR